MKKEKVNIKKRFVVGIIFLLIIFIAYAIGLTYATITKASPSSFTMLDGDTTTGYVTAPQSRNIVYIDTIDRFYAVAPEFEGGKSTAYYGYSDVAGYTTWNEGGYISYATICDGNGVLNYPVGSHLAIYWSNMSQKAYVSGLRQFQISRGYFNVGNISGSLIDWSAARLFDDENFYVGCFDITDDLNGYPIFSVSGRNDTGGAHWETGIWFAKSADPITTTDFDFVRCDSLPDNTRFASLIKIPEASAVYVVEGIASVTNKLWGGYVNKTVYDWGALTELSDNTVKIWSDTNDWRFVDYSVTYDSEYGHVCYSDNDNDLYYFTINVTDYSKSSETLVYNGTSNSHPFQPSITVNDYTPAIFFWNKTSSPATIDGVVVELNENQIWDIDNAVTIVQVAWSNTDYLSASIVANSNITTSIMSYSYGFDLRGSDFSFVGYGMGEEEETPIADLWEWLTGRLPLWMGLLGALMMIATPLGIIHAFKTGDIEGFAIFLLVVGVIGFCLVIGWWYG